MVGELSPVRIRLASGRDVFVDLLTIEAPAAARFPGRLQAADDSLLSRRQFMDGSAGAWYQGGAVHYEIAEAPEARGATAAVLMSALLYSGPVGPGRGFSELLVIFDCPWPQRGAVGEWLQARLSHLDWERHAQDRRVATSPARTH